MRLRDIVAGEAYAAVLYYRPDQHGRQVVSGRDWNAAAWEKLWHDAYPVRVIEVGVRVATYSTPGVRAYRLDPQTMERQVWEHSGEPAEDYAMRAVQLLMPWDEWVALYYERIEAHEEQQAVREEERKRERARRQEAAARDWMQRAFASARADIYDVMTVINGPFGEGWQPEDEHVRALVERRNPNGNPYLNGEQEAF